MNKAYELMVVVKPDIDVTEKSAKNIIETLMGDRATVGEITLLGKKKLAYPIQKQSEGIYILAKIEGIKMNVHEIEKKVQLGSSVLRFLLSAK